MLTKTMWIDYFSCPHKYKMILGGHSPRSDPFQKSVEFKFKKFADYFWSACDYINMDDWYTLIPENSVTAYDTKLMQWFIDFEIMRFNTLQEVGRDGEWRPQSLSSNGNNIQYGLTGMYDRVDYWNKENGERCLISFLLDNSYINKHVITQCMFDTFLCDDFNTITHGRVINPVTKKIKNYVIDEAERRRCAELIRHVVNTNNFPRTCNMNKHSNCLLCRLNELDICGESQ